MHVSILCGCTDGIKQKSTRDNVAAVSEREWVARPREHRLLMSKSERFINCLGRDALSSSQTVQRNQSVTNLPCLRFRMTQTWTKVEKQAEYLRRRTHHLYFIATGKWSPIHPKHYIIRLLWSVGSYGDQEGIYGYLAGCRSLGFTRMHLSL